MTPSLQSSVADPRLGATLELARSLFSQRHEAWFVFDTALCVHEWNPRIEELSGKSRASVLGKTLPDLFPRLRDEARAAVLRDALSGATLTTTGDCCVLEDPETAPRYDTHYLPLMRDGVVVAAAAVVRDRIAIRELEERLYESEQRFRIMADCAPVLLWMSGPDGRCDFFNQTWLDFRGRSQAQEYGFGWAEGVHPQDFQLCMDTFMDSLRQRVEFEMVYRLRRHDGVYRWILDHGAPRYSAQGDFAGYIGSCTDITDRKDSEDALRRASERLARSNAELERFAYAASHDLQEPLRMVTSYTALFADRYRGQLDEEADQFIMYASDGARRMKDIIDGLLSLARLKNLDAREFGLIDCGRAASKALDSLQLAIAEANAQIEIGPLPTVRAHLGLLSQVFQNLLHNAIKFRRPLPPMVSVSAERHEDEWRIAVQDNGIGIEMQYAERVFGMFQRLHPRNEFPGSGIGLALCKQVLELHGGRIWLESVPNKGTTIYLALPVA